MEEGDFLVAPGVRRLVGAGGTPALRIVLGILPMVAGVLSLPAEPVRVVSAERVARLTGTEGSDSINPTWEVGIGGRDLGEMVDFRGETYFFFGDTFSSELAGGSGWRWNTVAVTTDDDPSDGITFDRWLTDEAGRARWIIHDNSARPMTNIPTGAYASADGICVWYMAVSFWGTVAEPCWRTRYEGMAWSEDGEHYAVQEGFRFAPDSNFGMISAAAGNEDPQRHDGMVYLWGTPANRCGGVKLARVPEAAIRNQKTWEFYAGMEMGAPVWSAEEENALLVVVPRAGELSVMYNRWAGAWMMLYLTYLEGENIVEKTGRIAMRTAPEPWGPWSEPVEVVTPGPGTFGLYGSYMNPRYVEDDGRVVYFTMSLWEPYDVYWWRVELGR